MSLPDEEMGSGKRVGTQEGKWRRSIRIGEIRLLKTKDILLRILSNGTANCSLFAFPGKSRGVLENSSFPGDPLLCAGDIHVSLEFRRFGEELIRDDS